VGALVISHDRAVVDLLARLAPLPVPDPDEQARRRGVGEPLR
jgi:hypothetical protein